MPYELRTTRRVEFAETDQAGIVHFSHFFRYMEEAEHAFLRSLGTSVVSEQNAVKLSWPRVAAKCDFLSPAFFEDVLDVHLWVARVGTKSIGYRVAISREAAPLSQGSLTSVCCLCPHDRPMEPVPIPDTLREKIEPAPYGDEPECWAAAAGEAP